MNCIRVNTGTSYDVLIRHGILRDAVKEIMKIWKEVFEIEDISIQDDFYTLGGDSIILMRLVDEMCKTLGCDVTVDDILQSENISDLANRV